MHTSPDCNIYVYPRELDYTDARPLDDTWHRIDSSVRETDEDYVLPAALADRPEDSGAGLPLAGLARRRRRRADAAADRRARHVAPPCHREHGSARDELRLADNMTGAATLPQTKVIPQVDLVITHGGNNTTTEAMHFGKPMIVLPLFWDQYDNAQRVDELGYGVRLATYAFTDDELLGAVDRLLADTDLRARLDGDRRRHPGTRRAAPGCRDHRAGRPGAPCRRLTC